MARKRTNGFQLFANSRRAIYESQAGRRLSHKMLLELASVEWKNLLKEEQAAWLSQPKMSTPPPPLVQKRNPVAAMIRVQPNAGRLTSFLGMKKAHVVQQELVKRTYKCGLDRQTAREEFYGNLLWREKDHLDDLINRRWGIVVLSADGIDVANEIVCLCVENSRIVSEMRIYRPEAKVAEEDRLHCLDFLWNIDKPEDINTACIRMNRFIHGCCYNYILVASHQQAEISVILHQMKEARDRLHDRDTQSIRLDRLICIEDAVAMLRKLKNLPMVNMEQDLLWEELTGEWDQMTTIEHARAISEYFLNCLIPETVYLDDQLIEEQIEQVRAESDRRKVKKFILEPLFSPPQFETNQPTSMPSLTPPEHISPRFRRHPLPQRWRVSSSQQPISSPQQQASSSAALNRPNPFTFPPQVAQDQNEQLFQSVSRWLENISLDPTPIEEIDLIGEEENKEGYVH